MYTISHLKRFLLFADIHITLSHVFLSRLPVVLHVVLLFFPRGDVSDLDQPCLSTSAGYKGPQAKLFILTSFQENKLSALGASVP